jgi:hypothetical protein
LFEEIPTGLLKTCLAFVSFFIPYHFSPHLGILHLKSWLIFL